MYLNKYPGSIFLLKVYGSGQYTILESVRTWLKVYGPGPKIYGVKYTVLEVNYTVFCEIYTILFEKNMAKLI